MFLYNLQPALHVSYYNTPVNVAQFRIIYVLNIGLMNKIHVKFEFIGLKYNIPNRLKQTKNTHFVSL